MQSLDSEGHIWMLDAKQLDCMRQNILTQCQHSHDTQLCHSAPGLKMGSQTLHFVMLGKQAFVMRLECQSFRCRYKPPLAALKQCKTQLQFSML